MTKDTPSNMLSLTGVGVFVFVLMLLFVPLVSHAQQAWCDTDWSNRKKITVSNTNVDSNLTDFPLLINITDTNLSSTAKDDALDIFFTEETTCTKLKWEKESYASSTGALVSWVKVPTVTAAANTILYMYYGNSGASDQTDAPNTWDTNYKGVWHLSETPNASSTDSTSNNNDGNPENMASNDQVAGQIDGSLDFDGTDDHVNTADASTLDLTNTGTIEAWINPDTATSSESSSLAWTTQTAPDGAGITDDNDGVDITVVGDIIYYAAMLHDDAVETFGTATSTLEGTSFSGWTTSAAPDGAGISDTTSIAIDSDGDLLYYAVFAYDNPAEDFYTATSTLEGTNVTFTSQTAPLGAGAAEGQSIDMTIVNDTMYFAAFLASNGTESFLTATSTLDGTSFSVWTTQAQIPNGVGENETASIAIDSDGQQLYYSAFANTNTTERFYVNSSGLDGSGLGVWNELTAPDGAGTSDSSYTAMTIVGDKMYFAAFLHADTTETFQTANADLDGTNFSGWTTQANPDGAGANETSSPAITTDGKNLYYSAFAHDGTTETFKTATSSITHNPIISKTDAYELIQVGGGFVFDWEGSPKSFGSIASSTYAHIAVTHDGTTMKYYIDGVEKRTQPVTVDFASNANSLKFGGDDTFFDGTMDEIRISSIARTAAWIKFSYHSQKITANTVTLAAEEAPIVAGNRRQTPFYFTSSEVTSITSDSALVTWNTSIPTDTQLNWSSSLDEVLSESSVQEYDLKTSHSVSLSKLSPNTTYYYVVHATAIGRGTIAQGSFSFTTLRLTDTPSGQALPVPEGTNNEQLLKELKQRIIELQFQLLTRMGQLLSMLVGRL